MQRVIGIILSMLFLLQISLSQSTGTLRGLVRDSLTAEVLPFCNILIEGTSFGTSADANGYFVIQNLKSDKFYIIKVSYVGYYDKFLKVLISKGKITEEKIYLSPKSIEMREVTKIGNRTIEPNMPDIGVNRITIKQLEALPKGVEPDIFRALQYFAGVKFTSDVSAKYNVWGGESSHNLIQMDRVTLYNPYHALGLFSAIDMDVVNSIEFLKGGYTADFGGRLSSVLNIQTKTGNQKNLSAKSTLSLLTAKMMIEGPLLFDNPFLISVRKSHSSKILKKFLNNKNAPVNFWDVFGKLSLRVPFLSTEEKVSLTGFHSADKIEYDDQMQEDYNWSESFFSAKFRNISVDTPSFWEVYLSTGVYKGKVIPKLSSARYFENNLSDRSITADYTYLFENKNELKTGIQIKDIAVTQNLGAVNGKIYNETKTGSNIAVYGKYKFMSNENFGLDLGLRLNLVRIAAGTAGETFMEPRLSMTYRLNPMIKLKAALGKYTQELTAVSDENSVLTVFDHWVVVPFYIKPPQNWHYLAGLFADISDELVFEIESYYKSIGHFALINDKKYTVSDPDFIEASGRSYGADLTIHYTGRNLTARLSYSFSDVQHTVSNYNYKPKYNIKHAVSFLLDLNLGSGWRTGITWLYSSGRPFTKSVGYYDKADITNFADDNLFSTYYQYLILDEKNKGVLPDYHRMDLNLNKKLKIGNINCSLDFNILNLYNRANIFYYKRKTGERVNMLPFLPSLNLKVEI